MSKEKKYALIIGAGPAGLTAGYELLKETDITPIILEASDAIGGISKTVNYKGNRIDIGGHRFFSKSDRVMDWWRNIFPVQGAASKDDLILNRTVELSKEKNAPDPEKTDKVMLIRKRLSRIYFLRKFFDYPISMKWATFANLGIFKVVKIGISYLYIICFPIKSEKSLEDFFINRFGRELYLSFFKDYTEKVWGVPCSQIKPEWGAQRIKGLSITKTVIHALQSIFKRKNSISQKELETSLIEQFLYPKHGPGQLWEEVAARIEEKGGKILLNHKVIRLETDGSKISKIFVEKENSDLPIEFTGDYVFSTMPLKELILELTPAVPEKVKQVAEGLIYRDFITAGLLINKLKTTNTTKYPTVNGIIPDNWIYIQERDVKLGRIQIFNNWSPYLVQDSEKVWLGLEYFANEGDDLWEKTDEALKELAIKELIQIGFIENKDSVVDAVIIKTPKAYPAYFGTYDEIDVIKKYVNGIENLFPIGRNGMHRYNNMDHSMLTAMEVVKNIKNGSSDKENIWKINSEEAYHEEK